MNAEVKTLSKSAIVTLTGIATVLAVPFLLFTIIETLVYFNIIDGEFVKEVLKSNGVWTFITLLFSAPVALVIWHFRDSNASQQIENGRHDISLKEFHQIAEWISGIHLDGEAPDSAHTNSLATYRKEEGAIGLQIASIYSMLPYYRGDYGARFTVPALNILKYAWQMLHYRDLEQIKTCTGAEEKTNLMNRIRERAHSAPGIALMQVLFADDGKYLLQHPETLPAAILGGIDLYLPGLGSGIREKFFTTHSNYAGIQLQAANLGNTVFQEANLEKAKFQAAQLEKSRFCDTNLKYANLADANINKATFTKIQLRKAILSDTNGAHACFINSKASGANFSHANLHHATFAETILYAAQFVHANLNNATFQNTCLAHANLQGANLDNAILKNVNMSKTNLLNTKGISAVTLKNIEKISGSIINFSSRHNAEDMEILKNKGMVFIKGTFAPLKTKKTRLLITNPEKNISHEHQIAFFDIDLQETKTFNPGWIFMQSDSEIPSK